MKTLIFDWSGTLHDNFHCFCEICDMMFDYFGKARISAEEIRKNFSTPYMSFWNKYFPDLSIEEQKKLYEVFTHKTSLAKLYPTSKETIEFLYTKGYKLYILSSDPISKLDPSVKESGIKDMFKKIVSDIHDKKEGLVTLLKENNIKTEDAYYIGDTSGDIEAGKYAQIKTIGISRGFQDKSKLEEVNPDILIDDIIELQKL